MTDAIRQPLRTRMRRLAGSLRHDTSGLAMIEFAFAAPLVLGMGMFGTDTALIVIRHLQVSQIAMQVADNASRVGEENSLAARRVRESDISETLIGAEKLGGNMQIFEKGRIIISSLQQNAQGGQWIAWQRCRGAKQHNSSYGVEGDGRTGTSLQGMGVTGRLITATPGNAVMFVEVAYDYESVTPINLFSGKEISYTAAFNVRDARDLTGGPRDNGIHVGGPVARCNVFSAARPT